MTAAPPNSVLVVEDSATTATRYANILKAVGYDVTVAATLAEGRAALTTVAPCAVILDLSLPDGDGLSLLAAAASLPRPAPCVITTIDGSISRAVQATRDGAFDFLVKPVAEDRLRAAVSAAIRSGAQPAGTGDGDGAATAGLLGSSAAMNALRARIDRLATSNATVFITGESGSGKELCARAIHDASARRDGPFIAINCSAIPKDLLESELFGHRRGAFTGAVDHKLGAAAAAHGGTLFLDEICEMDLALQAKILRFLETSSVTPVGEVTPRPVDARILCATNRAPEDEVARGAFREDLFYRLKVLPLDVPPLRERDGDALELAGIFLHRFCAEEGKTFTGLTLTAQSRITGAAWRGNVRELANSMRHVAVFSEGGVIDADALPPLTRAPPGAAPRDGDAPEQDQAARALVGLSLRTVERLVIEATIEHADGSLPNAAQILEVNPSTLYRKREAWRAQDAKSGASDSQSD